MRRRKKGVCWRANGGHRWLTAHTQGFAVLYTLSCVIFEIENVFKTLDSTQRHTKPSADSSQGTG